MLKQLEYADSILRSDPLKAYELVVELQEALTTRDDKIESFIIETRALIFMTRIPEALSNVIELLDLLKPDDKVIWHTSVNNIMGSVQFDINNYDKSLEYFLKGLSWCKDGADPKTEAMILNNIGDIYNKLEVLDEALRYFRLSLDLAKSNDQRGMIGIVQLNMADIHMKLGEFEESLDQVNYALGYFSEEEDYIGISYGHYSLGRIYKSIGNTKQAKKELQLAINIMRRLHEKNTLILCYELMIEIHIEEKLYIDALEYVEDALEISKLISNKRELGDIALHAAKIYEIQENYGEALKFYKMYAETRATYEKDIEEEHQKNISAQINMEKTLHEKEIYRLKNVELRKKSDEIQKLYEDMNIINAISQDITSTLDIKKILYLLYDNINKLMDATMFGIFLYDNETKLISTDLFLEHGQPLKTNPIRYDDENSVGAWIIRNKKPILSSNFLREYSTYKKEYDTHNIGHSSSSVIAIPLMSRDSIIGAITVQSSHKDAYNEYHYNMLKTLASHITIAIKNSQESQKLSLEIQERIKTQNKLEILNEKLSHMSYMDALTNIPNRRSFVDYFKRELSRSKRDKSTIALLIIDIDFFKEYNDNYGHVEGDKCLFLVASLLKKALKREIDFVARYGGDEFVAVMTNIDYDGAYLLAEEMTANIKEHAIEHTYSPIEDIISITIGGYSLVPDDESMEQIIHNADNALYAAKDKGRNQICFYNDMGGK